MTRATLQTESALIAFAALWAYSQTDTGWTLFALLILLPDIAMLGYLAGPRIGAVSYNIAHNYLTAAASALVSPAIALIWIAHIAADRAIGYGLKYPDSFKSTHLDRL